MGALAQRLGPWVVIVFDASGFVDRIVLFRDEDNATDYAADQQANTASGRAVWGSE
jgi:hypothetical protein